MKPPASHLPPLPLAPFPLPIAPPPRVFPPPPFEQSEESQASTLIIVASVIGLVFGLYQFTLIARIK